MGTKGKQKGRRRRVTGEKIKGTGKETEKKGNRCRMTLEGEMI